MRSSTRWAPVLVVVSAGVAGCGGASVPPAPSQATTSSSSAAAAPSSPTGSSSSAGARTPVASSPSGGPGAAATESNPPGDIPDNQAYVAFAPPGAGQSVKVPEGWARSTAGPTTVFSDKLNRIQIVPGKATSAPTVSSVTHGELAKLASTVPKFAPGKVTAERRAAGPVVLVTFQGDSAQDPVTGKVVRDAFERYTYYRQGRRLDLTLSGPRNADNVDPWRIVSDSVRWQ